jgi:hypothetical protein
LAPLFQRTIPGKGHHTMALKRSIPSTKRPSVVPELSDSVNYEYELCN